MANQDYSVRQLLELEACTNCRYCAEVCPAVNASQEGKLSALYRMKGLKQILKGRTSLLHKLLGKKELSPEEWKAYSETVYRCTLCGNCQEVCPVGIHLKDLWLSLRQDLFHSKYHAEKVEKISGNLEESHNVFAEDNEERADWVEDVSDAPDHGFLKEKKIPVALAEILEASRVDFTLLGKEEWCCGFPLLGAGLKDMVEPFVKHNLEAVRKKGAKKAVFACPSCYQMWREHYPHEVEIAHASEFLMGLVKNGQVPLKALDLTVTYHDPCDLGRGARVFDAPREVIGSIPGVRLVELPRNRENCQCCGGGGNLEMMDPKLSSEIAKKKIEEALGTGAKAIVTSCQQCVRTMTTYAKRNKVPIDVMDITQLVRKALKR